MSRPKKRKRYRLLYFTSPSSSAIWRLRHIKLNSIQIELLKRNLLDMLILRNTSNTTHIYYPYEWTSSE